MNKENNELKDKLYLVLEELAEIKSEVDGMNYIISILTEVFEVNNQMNEFYITQLLEKYNNSLQSELSKVVLEIDELTLKM